MYLATNATCARPSYATLAAGPTAIGAPGAARTLLLSTLFQANATCQGYAQKTTPAPPTSIFQLNRVQPLGLGRDLHATVMLRSDRHRVVHLVPAWLVSRCAWWRRVQCEVHVRWPRPARGFARPFKKRVLSWLGSRSGRHVRYRRRGDPVAIGGTPYFPLPSYGRDDLGRRRGLDGRNMIWHARRLVVV